MEDIKENEKENKKESQHNDIHRFGVSFQNQEEEQGYNHKTSLFAISFFQYGFALLFILTILAIIITGIMTKSITPLNIVYICLVPFLIILLIGKPRCLENYGKTIILIISTLMCIPQIFAANLLIQNAQNTNSGTKLEVFCIASNEGLIQFVMDICIAAQVKGYASSLVYGAVKGYFIYYNFYSCTSDFCTLYRNSSIQREIPLLIIYIYVAYKREYLDKQYYHDIQIQKNYLMQFKEYLNKSVPIPLIVSQGKNTNLEITFINESAKKIFGKTNNEILLQLEQIKIDESLFAREVSTFPVSGDNRRRSSEIKSFYDYLSELKISDK